MSIFQKFGRACQQFWALGLLFIALTWLSNPSLAHATGVFDLPVVGAGSQTWIVDSADVISRTNENRLNKELQQLAEDSGYELRMVVLRRLEFDATIDSFADELFATWYPSTDEQANQALLVIDTLTNNATFRAGDEASTFVTPAIAESLVEGTVGASLRKGSRYNEALLAVAQRLVPVLSGETDPGPPEEQVALNVESTFTEAEDTDQGSATRWVVVLLVLATVIPMATYFVYVQGPG
ncbi:MAG: TPM domain-containing protein [Cyanobacteria bacterium P01_H01_bin.15]